MFELLALNPYFSAGAGLYGVGLGLIFARGLLGAGKAYFRRNYLVSLDITNRDPAYDWLLRWMAESPERFKYNHVSCNTTLNTRHANDSFVTAASFSFVPSPGKHFLWYGNMPIFFERSRNTDKALGPEIIETVRLTTFGKSPDRLLGLLRDAHTTAAAKESDSTVIYTASGASWVRFAGNNLRRKRPLRSVVLADGQAERLLKDMQWFLSGSTAAWYNTLGIPHRRGYLLYGPPGCGKSSVIMALAGELGLAICMVSLSAKGLSDESLMALLNSAPAQSLLLLEDVDSAFASEHVSRITYSGVLNALDGVAAQEGRIIAMTTNYPERLRAALVRPGRVDVREEVGHASKDQVRRMFLKFFPEESVDQVIRAVPLVLFVMDTFSQFSLHVITPSTNYDGHRLADEFEAAVDANTCSMAALQGYLCLHRDDPSGAVANAATAVHGGTGAVSTMDDGIGLAGASARAERGPDGRFGSSAVRSAE